MAARIFECIAYAVLRVCDWKRKTVEANLRHVSQGTWSWECLKAHHPERNAVGMEWKDLAGTPCGLYDQMLRNLTRHVGELLFCFDTYKRLPSDCAEYPCKRDGWIFEIAEGSAAVIEKMRRGGIFLTAHYGNYEASGAWLCALGVPLKASFIPLKPAWLNRMVYEKIRSVRGRPYSIDAKTPREFLNLLDGTAPGCNGQKQLFCLLADQDSRVNSALPGEFLGRPVKINPLPDFLLKHRPDSPVFFCWIEETGERQETRDERINRGKKKILHAVEADSYCHADKSQHQLSQLVQLMPKQVRHGMVQHDSGSIVDGVYRCWLEERIRENPALWYGWTHRRFRSVNPEIYKY